MKSIELWKSSNKIKDKFVKWSGLCLTSLGSTTRVSTSNDLWRKKSILTKLCRFIVLFRILNYMKILLFCSNFFKKSIKLLNLIINCI